MFNFLPPKFDTNPFFRFFFYSNTTYLSMHNIYKVSEYKKKG